MCAVLSVKEEVFWRNYFYRVSLIKQSAQLTALAAQQAVRKEKNGSEEDRQLTGSYCFKQTFKNLNIFLNSSFLHLQFHMKHSLDNWEKTKFFAQAWFI